MKKNFLLSMMRVGSLFALLGCGGGNLNLNLPTIAPSSNKTVNSLLSEYNKIVTNNSSTVQRALSSRPVIYVSVEAYQNVQDDLEDNKPVTFTIDLNDYYINDDQYCVYGIVNTSYGMIAETFITADYNRISTTQSLVSRSVGIFTSKSIGSSRSNSINNVYALNELKVGNQLLASKINTKKLIFTINKLSENKFNVSNIYKDNILTTLSNTDPINLYKNNLTELVQMIVKKILL